MTQDLSSTVAPASRPASPLQRLLDRMVTAVGASRGMALTVDRSRGLLSCRAVNQLPGCPGEALLYRVGQGNVGRVAQSGQPFRSQGVPAGLAPGGAPGAASGTAPGAADGAAAARAAAMLVVPVRLNNEVIAVLSLNGAPTPQGFSATDESTALALADEAAPQVAREMQAGTERAGQEGLTLQELIEPGLLHDAQESVSQLLGIPCVFEDPHGRCLGAISGAADFCVLMRSKPAAALRCELSMARAGSEAEDRDAPVTCECHAGVQTLIQPIKVREHFLGSLVLMLRYGARDAATVRATALELGLDPYEALARASMFPAAAAESEPFVAQVAGMVARLICSLAEAAIAAREEEERLTQKSGQLGALRELSRRLVGVTDSKLVVREALRRTVELTGALAADIALLSPDGRLQLAAQTGLGTDTAELMAPALADSPGAGAMRTWDLCRVDDIAREARFHGWVHAIRRETRFKSAVALPLGPSERPTGALTVYAGAGQQLSAPLLSALAEHTSLAISGSQAAERARSNEQAIRTFLSQMTRGLSSSIDKQSLMQWVTDFTAEMINAAHVVLYEFTDDELVAATTGKTSRMIVERPTLALGDGLSGLVASSRRALQAADIRRDSRFLTSAAAPPPDAVSYVGMPLLFKNELLGVLAVYSIARSYSDDELQLLSTFAGQAAVAIQNARSYEHQRSIATTMQQSFLPRERLRLEGVEVGRIWQPASGDVGGDYYDFIQVDQRRALIILGDVSGKGIRAATYTAMGKYSLRAYAVEDPSPDQLLGRTNAALTQGMEIGTFITLFCGLIDMEAGTLRYANAGHPDGLLFTPSTGIFLHLSSTGMMVGAIPGEKFTDVTIPISEGDIMVVYTDGVLEARHGTELFGIDRLKQFIAGNHALPPQELAEAIYQHVREFHDTGNWDDTCVLAVKFIGR